MSVPNQDLTIHEFEHSRTPNFYCEYCNDKVYEIAQRWYLSHWINYKTFLELTKLVF